MKLNHEEYVKALKEIHVSDEIKQSVLEKYRQSNSNQKYPLIRKFLQPVAVIVLLLLFVTTITAAAKILSMNEIFHNFFKEPAAPDPSASISRDKNPMPDSKTSGDTIAAGDKNPLKTQPAGDNNEFLSKTGTILQQKVSSNGLIITVRGLVGDRNAVYIAFDVETEDGKAFSGEEQNKLNSYTFDKVYLQIDDQVLGQYTDTLRIDDGKQPGKATFLIDEILTEEQINNITGHTLKLTLTDLKRNNNDITILNMTGDLRDILHQFQQPEGNDYFHYGYSSNVEGGFDKFIPLREKFNTKEISKKEFESGVQELKNNGSIFESYVLLKTGKEVPFTDRYPKLTVNNMGIIENSLYVNFNLHGEITEKELKNRSLKLINKRNGSIQSHPLKYWLLTEDFYEINGDKDQADLLDGQAVSIRYMLRGIENESELKDFIFAFGGDGSYDTVYEGQWEFTFDLNFKDTVEEIKLHNVSVGNVAVLETMELSPVSLAFTLRFSDGSPKNYKINPMEIQLTNGTIIPIQSYRYEYNLTQNTISCKALFPVLINSDTVKSLTINETVINLPDK
jgi:hypothetical protein